MIIKIDALDTLFFRDGKPFSMGENHWTDSIFLPNPSTIYGALRTAYFSQNIEVFQDLKKNNLLNSDKDLTKKLIIKNLFYRLNSGSYCYSMPRDLIKLKDIPNEERKDEEKAKKYKVYSLDTIENHGNNSNPLKYLLYHNKHVQGIEGGILESGDLNNYINGDTNDLKTCKLNDYYADEAKVGIGINKSTKTSKDSKLYRIDMLRLKNISLVVDFEGFKLKDKDIIKLGGERKYANYEKLDKYDISEGEIERPSLLNNGFKLCLLTPALSEKGWVPCSINEDEGFVMRNERFEIKLVAAAVGKYGLVGGYDMAKNKAKPMLKSVPAGSTYYFEIIRGDEKEIIEHFHLKSLSDIKPEEGYGIVVVAKWR